MRRLRRLWRFLASLEDAALDLLSILDSYV